jgi:hypothetical protein
MKPKEVILKLHLKSTFCQNIYFLFANYMVNVWFLQYSFWWGPCCSNYMVNVWFLQYGFWWGPCCSNYMVNVWFLQYGFWWGPCCSSFCLFVVVILLCVFTFRAACCGVRYDFRIKRCSVRLYLHLFAYSGVQHILCCVFVLVFFALCTLCSQITPSFFSNLFYLTIKNL